MAKGYQGLGGLTAGSEAKEARASYEAASGTVATTTPGAVKRLGYLFGLGGGVVALLLAVVLLLFSNDESTFEIPAYLLTAVLLFALLLALIRGGRRVWQLEFATFALLATFFLVRLAVALYSPGQTSHEMTDELSKFGFWFPTLYASVLFILGVDRGWRVSVGHFVLSVLLAVPLIVGRILSGELHVLFALSQLYVSSAVLIVIVTMFVRHTEQVTRANAEMEHLAHTDFITELANRRQIERLLGQEVKRVERYGGSLSLLLLDLDQFKRVNDAYGHPAGDQVLREIAALLASESRACDHLGRWGGEEFVLILPNTERPEALEMAERLMARVRDHRFAKVGKVTVSVGGAAWELGELPRDLIRRADEALYQAKGKGRDRVVMGGEAAEPEEASG